MEKTYKRTSRELSPETKEKISNSMKQYWTTVPPAKPANGQDFDSFIGTSKENKESNS